MSTWQIISDVENNFRWEIFAREDEPKVESIQPHDYNIRIPSMEDLLCQEYSKRLENGRNNVEDSPMFQTGLGKSIVIKHSSIEKAISVLGGEDVSSSDCLKLFENGRKKAESFPMFRTGVGKSVVIKQSSIEKALSVVADEDAFNSECLKLLENGSKNVESSPIFRTGSGKPVGIKESSIEKALFVLGSEDVSNSGQLHGRDSDFTFSNSLFQTGSGKRVKLSSGGLNRAKTLLGLEENDDNCSSPLKTREVVSNIRSMSATSVGKPPSKFTPFGSELKRGAIPNIIESEVNNFLLKPPSVNFQTAGGRSISVSSDALQRARSLLGDSEVGPLLNGGDIDDPIFSLFRENQSNHMSSMKENDHCASFSHQETAKGKNTWRSFVSPIRSASNQMLSSVISDKANGGFNLIKKFDESDPRSKNNVLHSIDDENSVVGERTILQRRTPGRPLADISNNSGPTYEDQKQTTSDRKRLGRRSSVSPFKRPRTAKFSAPLTKNLLSVPKGSSTLTSKDSRFKGKVSTRYPFQVPRVDIKQYFGGASFQQNMLEQLPEQVRWMNPENAEKYMFCDDSGSDCIGSETFLHMLTQSGAAMQYISKEWIANHYKWIVWKLGCYERYCPAKFAVELLTVPNVLEELKYRYEREVNYGHRSAIKRILEGDASPASLVVLCISAIYSSCISVNENYNQMALNGAETSRSPRIELTDGWYSIHALLDGPLSKQLVARKLFVGQKLQICGARLCGWVVPVSPLEASKTVSLMLHINGTRRAHWADRLGFSKGVGVPLAFRSIKASGGPVPRTLVGVARIYPILYKERFANGGSVVRSERMENNMMQNYNHRCSIVVEGVISEFQKGVEDSYISNDNDSEEGAKLYKILETVAEPEVIMAEMSPHQLTSFANYQAKLELSRQSDMQKLMDKGLKEAGLSAREVTPFIRLRVVGLTGRNSNQREVCPRQGLITIWSPTEKQLLELVEGKAYAIDGLIPLHSNSEVLQLQARGSATKWHPLSPIEMGHFEPFFCPRKPVLLSRLGDIPFSSEFDIAALVVYVGEVYKAANQKKQWIFVTDGSVSDLHLETSSSKSLLAISFCSPSIDQDSYAPVNHNLAGSTIGFCNLIKRERDQLNHLWVAEATENSTYFYSYDHLLASHLKDAAATAQKWANISSSTIEKLREKVLFIIGNSLS